MIDLFSSKTIAAFDRGIVSEHRCSARDLMERAAKGLFDCVREKHLDERTEGWIVLCGPGNNGGDGYALCNILHDHQIPFKCYGTDSHKYSDEARLQIQLLKKKNVVITGLESVVDEDLSGYLVIDCMFGIGLNRELNEEYKKIILHINKSGCMVVSADVPSGVNSDTGTVMGVAIRADYTVTFHYQKPGLFLMPGRKYSGEVVLVSLMPEAHLDERQACFLLERRDVVSFLPRRDMDSHKGNNGRIAIIAGSALYSGAALLCGTSCLRAGGGITTVFSPDYNKPFFAQVPEIICRSLGENGAQNWDVPVCSDLLRKLKESEYDSYCVGPGMGEIADGSFIDFIIEREKPAVFDADCLNYLSKRGSLSGCLHKKIVITPHPGELSRLMKIPVSEVMSDYVDISEYASKYLNCIVLLKGATSCITDGIRTVLNISGNSGLAKGGSGDVLSGILGALMGQRIMPYEAACCAAFLLGESADTAYRLLGQRMLVSTDVIQSVQDTIGQLFK